MPLNKSILSIKRSREARGFSIAELVITSSIMAIASVTLAYIFGRSTEFIQRGSDRDATAAAISGDIAKIERLNGSYACPPSKGCGTQENPPSKFKYAPENDETGYQSFKNLCSIGGGLSAGLVEAINQIPNPTISSAGKTIIIGRIAKQFPNNTSDGTHLYVVEWVPPQGTKRQITLLPTVAGWCP